MFSSFRTVIATLCAGGLAVGLAACRDDDDRRTVGTTTTRVETATPAEPRANRDDRKVWIQERRTRIERVSPDFDTLDRRAETYTIDQRRDYDRMSSELRRERRELDERLERAERASDSEWEEFKRDTDSAMDRFEARSKELGQRIENDFKRAADRVGDAMDRAGDRIEREVEDTRPNVQ